MTGNERANQKRAENAARREGQAQQIVARLPEGKTFTKADLLPLLKAMRAHPGGKFAGEGQVGRYVPCSGCGAEVFLVKHADGYHEDAATAKCPACVEKAKE